MKLYKYSLIAALALSGVLCACDDDIKYTPGPQGTGEQFYLPATGSIAVDIPNEATTVALDIYRVEKGEATTLNITSTVKDAAGADASDILKVPSTVTFENGATSAKIDVAVDFAKVVADEAYTLTVAIASDDISAYGAKECTYTLSYAPWTDWESLGKGVYTFTLLGSIKGEYDCDIYTRSSITDPDKVEYAVANLIEEGINFQYSIDLSKTIEVDGVKCPLVNMAPYHSTLENGTGSGVFFWWYSVEQWIAEIWGLGWENVDRVMELNGLGQSYFNPQTGVIASDVSIVSNEEDIPGTSASYGVGYEYVQLPGYANYDIMMNYTGNYVTPDGVEYALVNAVKTDDVANYVYDIFAGELDEAGVATAVEDIKANEELESVSDATKNLAFQIEEDGLYTVVAVGYNADGEEACKVSYTFEYATVQGAPKWESMGYCEYSDGFMSAFFTLPDFATEVEVQKSTQTEGLYRLVNPYVDIAEYFQASLAKGNRYLEFGMLADDQVYVAPSELGIIANPSYGEFAGMSQSYYLLAKGATPAEVAAMNAFGKMENGVITFPAGMLMASMSLYKDGAFHYANIDPENPTLAKDYPGDFDPYWGKGQFFISLNVSNEAPVNKINKSTSPINFNSVSKKTFEPGFKISGSKKLKYVDEAALQDYRRNHSNYKF